MNHHLFRHNQPSQLFQETIVGLPAAGIPPRTSAQYFVSADGSQETSRNHEQPVQLPSPKNARSPVITVPPKAKTQPKKAQKAEKGRTDVLQLLTSGLPVEVESLSRSRETSNKGERVGLVCPSFVW